MVMIQITLIVMYLTGECGTGNIAAAIKMTVIPWTLLFGVLLMFLHFGGPSISEGLKSPFANVFGYMWVSGKADALLRDILNKNDTEVAAALIEKVYGNPSLLINHLTPTNFEEHWKNLIPMMKSEDSTKKEELLDLTYLRDTVGEASWYLYTGLLSIYMVEYELSNYKCVVSVAEMNQQYENYKKNI